MAIIEELGLQVRVLCGASPCPEYEDPEPDRDLNITNNLPPATPSAHGFVESREDVEFCIEARALPGTPASEWIQKRNNILVFTCVLDGDHDRMGAFLVNSSLNPHIGSGHLDGDSLHKYRFAAVSLVESADKDRLARDTKKAQCLGSIQVKVLRAVDVGKTSIHQSASSAHATNSDEFSLSEKALKGKAVSLSTTYSRPVPNSNKRMLPEYVDPPDKPFAVFYLKYRSRSDLHSMLVIPRARTPSPLRDDDDHGGFANLSRAEIERLARERFEEKKGRSKRSRSVAVKPENRDDAQIPPRSRPFKYTRTSDGKKAIDLTEEDDD